jgi:iron complex outermembrane receptor protein
MFKISSILKFSTFAVFFTLVSAVLNAQAVIIGTVKDESGNTLSGASVSLQGLSAGTTTDNSGTFTIKVKGGTYTVNVSFVGFSTSPKRVSVADGATSRVDFTLVNSGFTNEVVVLGSRALPRTQLETPVPVDVIDIKKIAQDAPQVYINQILSYVAPSFNSGTQTVADGSDHIDPASLRGLGPDQVLVLINGKRRHNTALVNINGTFGRGSVGTDLNAIPVAAIDRIEILRDAASAQYGSDAIAGVINIILKSSVNRVTFSTTAGANVTNFLGKSVTDGQTVQNAINFGIPMGQRGGFINFSGSFDYRNYTNRAGERAGTIFSRYNGRNASGAIQTVDKTDSFLTANNLTREDFKQRVGQSRLRSSQFMFNSVIPTDEEGTEFYIFGGMGYRNGQAAANFRLPNNTNNILAIYPLGFLPEIHSDIYDRSLAFGIRGKLKGWNVDFSNTFGQNQFLFKVVNTLNSTMGVSSPTRFNSGGPVFTQNTTNLDFSRSLTGLSGINVAFGVEHRFERYQLIPGEEASYADYGRSRQVGIDAAGKPILVPDLKGLIVTKFGGPDSSALTGGAQSFPGFRPENAVNATRSAIGAYADGEFNFSKAFLIDGAVRFENYNDFGSNVSGKISLRYKVQDNFAIRGSVSTGFRAPSLHQRYFSNTSTLFVGGIPYEVATFPNDSRAAKLLGIPELRAEKSKSVSLGFTGNLGKFKVTVDGYLTRINDRVIYTDLFVGSNSATASASDRELYNILVSYNANRAQFFANAINSETKGIDLVVSYGTKIGAGNFRADLAGTVSKTMRVGPIMSSELLKTKESIYFSEASRIYLESSVPRVKGNVTLTYGIKKWNFFIRNVYFGAVDEATTTVAYQQTFDPRIITEISLGYKISKSIRASVGSNNIFDIYPEKVADPGNTTANQFIYSRRATQFGYNGRYIYGRFEISL